MIHWVWLLPTSVISAIIGLLLACCLNDASRADECLECQMLYSGEREPESREAA